MNKSEYRAKRVIMEATFKAIPMAGGSLDPYFNDNKGYVDIGTFEVRVPGHKEPIPFDFEATVKALNKNCTCTYGNWDGLAERIFDVDPCFELEYEKNGLKMDDITAKLLSSAERLEEIDFGVYDLEDEPVPCFIEVQKVEFLDEWDNEYAIRSEVLRDYNQRHMAEQVAEFIEDKLGIRVDHTVHLEVMDEYTRNLQSKDPTGVLAIINQIQSTACYLPENRAEADFIIDCMLQVAESKNSIYRVGLVSHGNPDHDENPYERLPGLDAKYAYCASVNDCQEAAMCYIMEHDLGGGQWTGGMVYKGGTYIGSISYNGRFWNKATEYGSVETLKKTELPMIDAGICGYGKNLFYHEVYDKKKDLDEKVKKSKKESLKGKTGKEKDMER